MTGTGEGPGASAGRPDAGGTGRVPASNYVDPARAELERRLLFARTWLVVDRSAAVAEPGDFVVWERLGQSVVVARDEAGGLSAFHNVCQHRGARIAAASGHCSNGRLTCPWHGFVYDLTGRAVGIPSRHEFDPADIDGLRAPEVAVHEWAGLIWVNLAGEGAEPFDAYLGELGTELDWYGLDGWKYYGGNTWTVGANWKTVLEGFLEAWHTPYAHRATIRGGYLVDDTTFRLLGRHSMMVTPMRRDDISQAAGPVEHRARADCHYLAFPNTFFNMFPHHGQVVTVYPVGVDATVMQAWVFGRREVPEGESYEAFDASVASSLVHMTRIATEDIWLAEQVGATASSFGYTRNIFGRQEIRLTAFEREVERYLDA